MLWSREGHRFARGDGGAIVVAQGDAFDIEHIVEVSDEPVMPHALTDQVLVVGSGWLSPRVTVLDGKTLARRGEFGAGLSTTSRYGLQFEPVSPDGRLLVLPEWRAEAAGGCEWSVRAYRTDSLALAWEQRGAVAAGERTPGEPCRKDATVEWHGSGLLQVDWDRECVVLLEGRTGRLFGTFEGVEVEVSPDGRLAATCSTTEGDAIVELESGRRTPLRAPTTTDCGVFSSDGALYANASPTAMRLWSARTGWLQTSIATRPDPKRHYFGGLPSFFAGGHEVLYAMGAVQVAFEAGSRYTRYDTASGTARSLGEHGLQLLGARKADRAVTFLRVADPALVVCPADGGRCEEGPVPISGSAEAPEYYLNVQPAVSADGEWVVLPASGQELMVVPTRSGRTPVKLKSTGPVRPPMGISPDGRFVVAERADAAWRTSDGALLYGPHMRPRPERVEPRGFADNDRVLLTRTDRLELDTGRVLPREPGSQDERWPPPMLWACPEGGDVRLGDDGIELRDPVGGEVWHTFAHGSVAACSADGRWLAAAGGIDGDTVELWSGRPWALRAALVLFSGAAPVLLTSDGRFEVLGQPEGDHAGLRCTLGDRVVPLDQCRHLRVKGIWQSMVAERASRR